MPSLSDRQEIAERLRKAGERLDKEAPSSLTGTACITLFELLESAGIRDSNSYSDIFNRLADLIDPTCELDLDFCMEYIVCQSCGYELPHGTHLDETKYCPNCGSRVVVSKDD